MYTRINNIIINVFIFVYNPPIINDNNAIDKIPIQICNEYGCNIRSKAFRESINIRNGLCNNATNATASNKDVKCGFIRT